jgi:hypothetical protein
MTERNSIELSLAEQQAPRSRQRTSWELLADARRTVKELTAQLDAAEWALAEEELRRN